MNLVGLLLPSMGAELTIHQVIVNEENSKDTQNFLTKRLSAIKNQRNSGELEDLALIIGKSHHDISCQNLTIH